MRCKYCFEEPMHNNRLFDMDTIQKEFKYFLDEYLDSFVTQLIEINQKLHRVETNITFHGGEPLLVGSKLLRKGFEQVKRHPRTIIGIQTNGTLITDDIIDLFEEFDVHVGVSLDGPKYMHDAYRLSFGGAPTYDIVSRNIEKMQSRGVSVGVLATITDLSVKKPDEFYRYFAERNLFFSFNPCFTDPNLPSTYKSLNIYEYIKFYKKMFDLWIHDNTNNLSISCFERILSAMSVKKTPYMEVCSYIPDCSKTTVAINTNGDFYRCLHYCMDEKNRIGTLSQDPLCLAVGNCMISDRWSYLQKHDCKDCDVKEFCCGGCPYVAESVNGTLMSRSNTCLIQKEIVHHIYNYMLQFTKTVKNDISI